MLSGLEGNVIVIRVNHGLNVRRRVQCWFLLQSSSAVVSQLCAIVPCCQPHTLCDVGVEVS